MPFEIDDEDKTTIQIDHIKVWRLIRTEFKECEETIINEKYVKLNY